MNDHDTDEADHEVAPPAPPRYDRECCVCHKTFSCEWSAEEQPDVACDPCIVKALRSYGRI